MTFIHLRLKRMHVITALMLSASMLLTGCWSYINKESAAAFHASQTPFSVTVYPINVVKGLNTYHDKELAGKLVSFLKKEGLANPAAGNTSFSYPFQWGHNQAAMVQRTARAFSSQVTNDKLPTDYALLIEILCNAEESQVIGVEYFLMDKDGQPADGSLSNSDWPVFKEVNPVNRQGGLEVAEKLLLTNWKNKQLIKQGI